jgi:hypothetical protein
VTAVLVLLAVGSYLVNLELNRTAAPDTGSTGAPPAAGDDAAPRDPAGPHLRPGPFARPPSSSTEAPPGDGGTGGPLAESPCGPFPSFPDASCTGWEYTGVTLRDCPTLVDQPGAELDGCRFAGGLTLAAADVTITRSRIEGGVGRLDGGEDLQNLMLIDVEIDGSGERDPNSLAAIGNDNYTCVRCHIHDTGRGANLGRNVHIEASYLHDFPQMGDNHLTAIGSNGGSNFTIIHNNLECAVSGCSAALALYGDFAPIDNALIQHNLFNTYGSFCTYGGSVDGKNYPVATDVRYLDNRFGRKFRPDCGAYGPVDSFRSGQGNFWRGNEWEDGSGPITP